MFGISHRISAASFRTFKTGDTKSAVFCVFLHLARSLQSCWHRRRMVRQAGSGRQIMTYTNLSQLSASLVAALVATTIFVTAAVGPAVQFI
jgi:hypothetical protein